MVAVFHLLAAADSPGWQTWAPTLLAAITTAGLGTFGVIWVKRMSRPVDNATVLKTHVEAEKIRAETDRMRIDSEGREVEIARGLLDDIRKELDRYRAEMDRVRAASEHQISLIVETNEKQHAEVVGQLDAVRAEQAQLRDQLEQHIPWDIAARELLQHTNPEFPSPPPISGV